MVGSRYWSTPCIAPSSSTRTESTRLGRRRGTDNHGRRDNDLPFGPTPRIDSGWECHVGHSECAIDDGHDPGHGVGGTRPNRHGRLHYQSTRNVLVQMQIHDRGETIQRLFTRLFTRQTTRMKIPCGGDGRRVVALYDTCQKNEIYTEFDKMI